MQKEYVFERNNRTFKCRVYDGPLSQLGVDIFEKVKFFSTTRWKRKQEYRAYRHYSTAYELAERALEVFLIEENAKAQQQERMRKFWGIEE